MLSSANPELPATEVMMSKRWDTKVVPAALIRAAPAEERSPLLGLPPPPDLSERARPTQDRAAGTPPSPHPPRAPSRRQSAEDPSPSGLPPLATVEITARMAMANLQSFS